MNKDKLKVVTQPVAFPLTLEEVDLKNVERIRFDEETERLETQLTGDINDAKASVKRQEQDAKTLMSERRSKSMSMRNAIKERTEMRLVACYEEFDLTTKTVVRKRSDTQEKVFVRPMDDGEIQLAYQGELFPKPPPADAAASEKAERDDAAALAAAGPVDVSRAPPGLNDAPTTAVTPAAKE